MSRIPPAEGNLPLRKRDEAVVGNGDAMGIATQILQHILGAAEWWFCVNHPVFSEEQSRPSSESFGLGEGSQVSVEAQSAALEGLLQTSNELTAKTRDNTLRGRKKRFCDFTQ